MQAQNVTKELFDAGANGFLSGNPLKKIGVYAIEAGGPIKKDRLWYWGAVRRAGHQRRRHQLLRSDAGVVLQRSDHGAEEEPAVERDHLRQPEARPELPEQRPDDHQGRPGQGELPAERRQQVRLHLPERRQDPQPPRRQLDDAARGDARSSSATRRGASPNPTHQIQHTLIASDKLVFNNSVTFVDGGFFLDYQDRDKCGDTRYIPGTTNPADYASGAAGVGGLPLEHPGAEQPHDRRRQPRRCSAPTRRVRSTWEAKTDGTYFLTHVLGGDHSLKFGLGYRKAPIMSFSHYSGGTQARVQCVGNTLAGCGDGNYAAAGSASGIVPFSAVLYRDQLPQQRLVELQRLPAGQLQPRPDPPERRSPLRLAAVQVPRRLRAAERRRPESAAGAVRRGDDDRRDQRQDDSVVRQLVAAPVGHLRPVRQRQDAGARERVVLLRHQDHPGQRAERASSRRPR